MKVFKGRLVHSVSYYEPIQILEDRVIGFQDKADGGKILFIENSSEMVRLSMEYGFDVSSVKVLTDSEFLMPGLVDTHVHAPQYVNSGIGYDKRLLDWLNKYTFPAEAKCKDLDYARIIYTEAVKQFLRHGTTTACYFATIHLDATKELCKIIEKLGQRALVGKVNMDQNSPDYYVENTQESVEDTREFVRFALDMKNPLIGPVITPRFPISCSLDLLKALGDLAQEYNLPIQSHLCEQKDEIDYTMSLFPDHRTITHIFEATGLLTEKTLMAHCIHMEEDELQTLQKRGVGMCHCPTSNFNQNEQISEAVIAASNFAYFQQMLSLRSGLFDISQAEGKRIHVGLGTDVSGGHSPSILSVMRSAIDNSRAVQFSKDDFKSGKAKECEKAISHHHAFYLATLGGAKVLSMGDKIGNFEVNKEFDALLINIDNLLIHVDTSDTNNPVSNVFPTTFEDILMKFLYLGDDRNIIKRFVAGQQIDL